MYCKNSWRWFCLAQLNIEITLNNKHKKNLYKRLENLPKISLYYHLISGEEEEQKKNGKFSTTQIDLEHQSRKGRKKKAFEENELFAFSFMCVIDLQLHETIFTLLTANGHQTKKKVFIYVETLHRLSQLILQCIQPVIHLLYVLHVLAFNHHNIPLTIPTKDTRWK